MPVWPTNWAKSGCKQLLLNGHIALRRLRVNRMRVLQILAFQKPRHCWPVGRSLILRLVLWTSPHASRSALNPRPGGGLSHLRPGEGAGGNNDHTSESKLRGIGRPGKKRWIALDEYFRKYFDHFFRSGQYWGDQRSPKVKFSGVSYYFFGNVPLSQNLL